MSESNNRMTAGCGVFIKKGNSILIGKRGPKARWGSGLWSLPGGMLDPNESFAECARREVMEETGLRVTLPHSPPFCIPGLLAVTDHMDLAQQVDGRLKDHLSFWILTHWFSGEPVTKEPTKCLGWEWKTLSEISKFPGANNPTDPQYYWTPWPLWQVILSPAFGRI